MLSDNKNRHKHIHIYYIETLVVYARAENEKHQPQEDLPKKDVTIL